MSQAVTVMPAPVINSQMAGVAQLVTQPAPPVVDLLRLRVPLAQMAMVMIAEFALPVPRTNTGSQPLAALALTVAPTVRLAVDLPPARSAI